MLSLVLSELALSDPFDRYFFPSTPGALRPDKFRGKRVRIPKGALVHSMHPSATSEWLPLKRAATITVFASSPGHVAEPYWARHRPDRGRSYHHAELTWPGSGGYWKRVHLRAVELLDDIDDIPVVTPAELKQFDDYLASSLPTPLIDPQISV